MSASKHRLYFLIQRVAHRLKTDADAALSEVGGLSTAQAAVMLIIARHGPVTQRYVAEALSQRESAVTAMAVRLLKAGYITRERSVSDGRAWELKATLAGHDAISRMRKPFNQINAVLDECFTADEVECLVRGFNKILKSAPPE